MKYRQDQNLVPLLTLRFDLNIKFAHRSDHQNLQCSAKPLRHPTSRLTKKNKNKKTTEAQSTGSQRSCTLLTADQLNKSIVIYMSHHEFGYTRRLHSNIPTKY